MMDPEREPAGRRYAAALTALDEAAEPSATVTASAAAAAADLVRLNDVWHQNGPAPGDHAAAGRLKRIAAEIGRLLPWRRRRLNGAMIAAIQRNTETTRALIDATQHFHSHVVWYAQTVLAVTATGRAGASTPEGVEALQRALTATSTEWLVHWESLTAREQRYDARMAALTKAYENVIEIASLAQQNAASVKRAVDALASSNRPTTTSAPVAGMAPAAGTASAPSAVPAMPGALSSAPDTNAFKYLVFEDRYRGSREDIRRRLADYLPLFEGASDVLDIGCGRGELLDLFREQGISARGIDINDEMVETCRSRGLTAERADALSFLAAQPDASLGGLIAIQVVEHLDAQYLMRLTESAYHKLKPGATLVFETVNTACWAAFFDSYIRDFTHVHPLHPDTLRYLVQASGFSSADLRFLSPIADHDKLPVVKILDERDVNPTVRELVEAVNGHASRLNSQLFTYRDYAVIAKR